MAPQPGSGIQISCAEGQKTSPSTSFLLGELGGILSSPPTPTLAPWYYTPYFLPSPSPYLVVRRHVPRRHAPRHYAPRRYAPRRNASKTTCPMDIVPQDIMPQDNMPHKTICPMRRHAPKTICPIDNMPHKTTCPIRQHAP